MPNNEKHIKDIIDVLRKAIPKPINFAQAASIDPVPASLNQGRDAAPTQTASHITQLVEASIVHDMTHVEGLDSIKENDFAKRLLSDVTRVTSLSHQGSDYPAYSICLTGPNGTGKTSLLLAAVKTSGRKLIMVQSKTLSNSLVGDSEK